MKKPPRPRITKTRLKWIFDKRNNVWVPYHRVTWTESGKRRERQILLKWQGDPRRLDELYWQCESGFHDRQKPPPPQYTWQRLIIEWRSDPKVQGKLAQSTKVSYRRDMDAILEKNADKDVQKTSRQALRKAHARLCDTPRKADKYLTTISLLWNYAKQKLDWPLGDNPAEGIEKYGTQREFLPWPDWMVAKLETAPQSVRTACELILCTGQRPSAAIGMRFDDFDGEWMRVIDEKGKANFEVYCPDRLRRYVAQIPKKGAHLLAKNLTECLGYNVIEHYFRAWRKSLGRNAAQYSMHGLRKLSIIRLAEAGCTDAQIQSVTNQSLETVAYYRRLASKKTLSKAAMTSRNDRERE